jgi:predicted alpha/beta-hydrolase family hydrolase
VFQAGTILLSMFLLLPALAQAQEMVTLETRPGVTLPFFIADMGGRKPEAVALLYIGGGGAINLRREDGQVKFGAGNFLPRSRREFIRNGVLPVILDAPSDHSREMSDPFRTSEAHARDARAVVAEMKKRHPGVPVFLVGTSRGTVSVAYLGTALGGEVAGVVLTSSLFYGPGRPRPPLLSSFDWTAVKVPLVFVHHRDDGCGATPYLEAERLGRRFPLISVAGGKPPESGPCDPLAPHGFFGKEAQTVDAIAAWMLGKPFAKEIR